MPKESTQANSEENEIGTRIIEFPSQKLESPEAELGAGTPLHQTVVATLRDLIVHNELPPGRRLNERILCERLKLSRTRCAKRSRYSLTKDWWRCSPIEDLGLFGSRPIM